MSKRKPKFLLQVTNGQTDEGQLRDLKYLYEYNIATNTFLALCDNIYSLVYGSYAPVTHSLPCIHNLSPVCLMNINIMCFYFIWSTDFKTGVGRMHTNISACMSHSTHSFYVDIFSFTSRLPSPPTLLFLPEAYRCGGKSARDVCVGKLREQCTVNELLILQTRLKTVSHSILEYIFIFLCSSCALFIY